MIGELLTDLALASVGPILALTFLLGICLCIIRDDLRERERVQLIEQIPTRATESAVDQAKGFVACAMMRSDEPALSGPSCDGAALYPPRNLVEEES